MRALATIVTVGEVVPIEGADFIEYASIVDKAWKCVVKKGELKEGDTAVYFEIDSFLPEEERFEFLRKSSYKTMDGSGGFRLKTIRLKGHVSQGLLLPQEGVPGTDVTETFGVKLYEAPIAAQLQGKVKGNFPSFLRKSNQERIQNLTKFFDIYKDEYFEVTEKMDGSSCSVFRWDGEFGICSRNLQLKEGDSTFWKVCGELRDVVPEGYMLQGELVGEGIQKNPHKLKGHGFFVYNIFDIMKHEYVDPYTRQDMIEDLNLVGVPVIDTLKVFQEYPDFDSLMAYAESHGGEGIVCKSQDGQVSFKVINNSYL